MLWFLCDDFSVILFSWCCEIVNFHCKKYVCIKNLKEQAFVF